MALRRSTLSIRRCGTNSTHVRQKIVRKLPLAISMQTTCVLLLCFLPKQKTNPAILQQNTVIRVERNAKKPWIEWHTRNSIPYIESGSTLFRDLR
jgi:hypothetical protein